MPGYSPKKLGEPETFNPCDELKFDNASLTAHGQFFDSPRHDAGIGAESPEATAPFKPDSWPSDQTEIPPSPGEALLEEFDAILPNGAIGANP